VHIAFAIDPRYLPWCAVAIRSCLDHGTPGLTVHLLHDGSLEGNSGVDDLAGMVEDAGASLAVHAVDPAAVAPLPLVGRFGSVVWLRLLLPELLPDVRRVLYLDADTLVVSPLAPLFASDLEGAPLAAVPGVTTGRERAHMSALGVDHHERHLNSGVLLLDLDRFRAEHLTDTLLRVATTRSGDLMYPDQDTLNLVFAGRWFGLHPRWNAQNMFWNEPEVAIAELGADAVDEARRSPAILHFEGPTFCKPWHAINWHPWRRVWWDTLKRTPWSGTPPEDHGTATTLLRVLPPLARIRGYFLLRRLRDRHVVTE